MKLFNLLFLALFASISLAQAQDTEDYLICTEIHLDDPDNDITAHLPPGMTAKAVAYKPELGKYWENGRNLRVRFIGGSETARSKVRQYAKEWSNVANITFTFVEKGQSDLRVAFNPGMGTWSLIGTDATQMEQDKPTMNFSWLESRRPESETRATILHEFGHTLGLLHEHQNPASGIPWDKPKLYQFYRQTQGWDKSLVDQQVLARVSATKTQYTKYDPYSIMHYPVPNALTVGDFEIGMNKDLSPTDRAFIAKVYPKPAGSKPYVSTNSSSTKPTTHPTSNSKPVAASKSFRVTFHDVLPESQKREQVWVTLGGVTKTFVLDQKSGTRDAQIVFQAPEAGRYAYEIYTKTTFLKRVNGHMQESVLRGYGKGTINLKRESGFDLAVGKALNDQWFEVQLVAGK